MLGNIHTVNPAPGFCDSRASRYGHARNADQSYMLAYRLHSPCRTAVSQGPKTRCRTSHPTTRIQGPPATNARTRGGDH